MMTRVAFVLLCSLAALGCAKTRMAAGTDGATHFLLECERDTDCGELSCLCGVCSLPCERDEQCSTLNSAAECAGARSMSCGDAEQSCTIECDEDDACSTLGDDARCTAGQCIRPARGTAGQGGDGGDSGGGGAGTGGSGSGGSGGTGGRSGGGGSGGAGPTECAAMDARSNGDDCFMPVGFTWNGASCEEVQCGCEGSECDALFPTRAACEIAYAECAPPCSRMDAVSGDADCALTRGYSWNGTSCDAVVCTCVGDDCELIYETQAACDAAHSACAPLTMCSRSTDCAVVDKRCCGCDTAFDDLAAVAEEQLDAHTERVCEPYMACPDCATPQPTHVVAAACRPSTRWEGGECSVLRLDGMPCTEDAGCRVRVRRCCECNVTPDISVDELFAMPVDFDAEELFCGSAEDCCLADAEYPENVEARCEENVCNLYLDGDRIAR